MNKLLKFAAVTAIAVVPSVALAATFDFVGIADTYRAANGGEEASFDQAYAFDASAFTDNGISILDISAGGTGDHAFFDGTQGGTGYAGLGVCSSGFDGAGISECSSVPGIIPGDDNVDAGETFTLLFDMQVMIEDLFFYDAVHQVLNGTVEIDGSSYAVTNGALDPLAYDAIGYSASYDFAHNGSSYYLGTATVAPIPVPAAFGFLAVALGGLGVVGRRRKS